MSRMRRTRPITRRSALCSFALSLCACRRTMAAAVPDRVVVLSFDDAAASHATFVAPLLKKYGFGGTFFVCEFPPDFDDKTKYMSWEQIRRLHDMGFETGSHTRTHTHVTKMSPDQFVAELAYIEDKCTSNGILKPISFAYPAYETHPSALKVLAERGYRFARAGGSRSYDPAQDNPLLVPSFSTSGDHKQGVLDALKQARDGKVVVFTVHGVPDYPHPAVTTPPELFEEYLRYMSENHYTPIALRELARFANPIKTKESL
jgi:peptidoglycan/xylan/chitin deacetylase (PgdA/CDA1 family)